MSTKVCLRISIPLLAVLSATAAGANQGVAVQNSGQTIILWADPDGTVHGANAGAGQGVGTFSPWEPIAGVDLDTTSNGAVSPPAIIALHDPPNGSNAGDNWYGMWQGPGYTLFTVTGNQGNPGLNKVVQLTVGGTPVTSVCSAPTLTYAPSGTIYAAVAACSGYWAGTGLFKIWIPEYPLQVFALSPSGNWSTVAAPAELLEGGTAPSIFARTQGGTAGEIDIAYQASDGSLEYVFCPAGRDPTVSSSWSTPYQIAPTITSQPSLYVNPQQEADIVAQLPNNVLGIWYATPGSQWGQIPMASGSATGAPSIGGGLYAPDPVNAPGSLIQTDMIATPEDLNGSPTLVGVGWFQSSAKTFSISMQGMSGYPPVVLGVGVGGITPRTKDSAGNTDPTESNVTVSAVDTSNDTLNIANIVKGSVTTASNWDLVGPAEFKNPACQYPVSFTNHGNGARSGPVTIVPLYWGYNPSSSEPNWPDYYKTLLGSSYYHWIAQQYGVTTQLTVDAPQAFDVGDTSLYQAGNTGCSSSDWQCIVRTRLRGFAKIYFLPNPTGSYQSEEYVIHAQDGGNVPCGAGFNESYSWTDSSGGHTIYYAITTDGACNADAVEGSVAHELLESLTDPDAFGWSAAYTANDCGQIADLCQSEGFHILSNATNQNWRFDRMWSNNATSCLSTSGTYALTILGKCVDLPNGNTANGTAVNIWDCNGGTNQQWSLNSDGSISPALAPNKCLDLPNGNTANGTKLGLWDCHDGTNQRWTRYLDGSIHGVGNKCVDNPDWQTTNGTQFDYWDCNGGTNQTFQLQ